MARATAWIEGRDYVIPEDVTGVFIDCLDHRLLFTPEGEDKRYEVLTNILRTAPRPAIPLTNPSVKGRKATRMIKRWLTYGITLLLAFVFYGVYTGYLSLFTLAGCSPVPAVFPAGQPVADACGRGSLSRC